MHSFATITAITATMANLAASVPLANGGPKHARLHAARALNSAPEPEIVKLAPVLRERDIPTVQLDLMGGTCGGSTGFGCAEGFCCSKWGYCGQGSLYCGDAPALNGTKPSAAAAAGPTHAVSAADKGPGGRPHKGRPHHWGGAPGSSTDNDLPSYTPPSSPPVYSSPPETSAAAPATSAAAPPPAPSSYVAPPPASSAAAPEPATSSAAAPSAPAYEPQPSSPSSSSGGNGLGDVYKMYSGNGAASSGWPSQDQWASFEDSWSANVPTMKISCSQFGQEDPTDDEIADMKSAIQDVAGETGVDERFILAIMMQESKGCVRAPTTSWSHDNPGLFQSFIGTGTCNPDGTGVVPCPSSMIKQMVSDGVAGTASGPGLKDDLEECPSEGAQKYYEAARIYNAGSIPSDGNLGAAGATACYCSDVANRLTGWTTAESGCTL